MFKVMASRPQVTGLPLLAALALACPFALGADDPPRRDADAVYPSGTPAKPGEKPSESPAGTKPAPTASIPGLTSETFSVPPGRYFAEGTFLVRRTGTLRVLKNGDVLFIPDKPARRDSRRRGERPMILLPCQTLAALQSSVNGAPDPLQARVEVSGQLFVYRDRQQLLPTVFTALPTPPDAKAPPKTGAAEDPENATAVQPTDDPEVSDMITQLENRRGEVRSLPKTGAAEPDEKAAKTLVPEGTILTDRRGRLTKVKNMLAIAFDGDPNTAADPAMVILPSRALERLEAAMGPTPDGVVIVLTGRVYSYRNQNYILPLLAQIEADGQLKPMQ
ncbi:MAG: hypothetical protein K2Y21_13715 [Phycisphaerales bacterium]|nr:hypothetical protein [Phycisphaerales bacterium]